MPMIRLALTLALTLFVLCAAPATFAEEIDRSQLKRGNGEKNWILTGMVQCGGASTSGLSDNAFASRP